MPLKDHKEELRCVRDIAVLLKWYAQNRENLERAQAIERAKETERARIMERTGIAFGSW